MKNLRMFEVKYIGATVSRGSRLKITDTRFGTSITLSKSYNFDDVKDQAIDYLKSKGIEVSCRTWNEKSGTDYLMTENFTDQIK